MTATLDALREVWKRCVDAKDDRTVFAGDYRSGCRPHIDDTLMWKILNALVQAGDKPELPYSAGAKARTLVDG